ncbi:MAG: cytochrome b N-terminal domain-containing protein [Planctomycetota bacterium]
MAPASPRRRPAPRAPSPRALARARRAFFGTRSRFVATLKRVGSVRISVRYRRFRWITAIVLLLVLVQIATGILLSLYYNPGPTSAYTSTRFFVTHVPLGWLMRSVHAWAADLLLGAVLLHLALVFFRGAYSRPREYVWMLGVCLLLVILALRFTGRVLPWDEVAYATARDGLAMIADVPIVGGLTAVWLRGGVQVGVNTLSRFFTTHVMILPWLGLVIFSLHAYLVRGHGLAEEKR